MASAVLLPKGLQYDRRWMLLNEQGEFMTQRAYPSMALFQPSIDGGVMTIARKDSPASTHFDIEEPTPGSTFTARIWNDEVDVAEVNESVSRWFSEQMGIQCRLVRFPENNPRPVDKRHKINDDHVSLADAYPFLIIGQASLDDLNARLEVPVPMNRFRPNFVFGGGAPFEEDNWGEFSIGEARFVGVKLCERCTMPTVDQNTGQKGAEPLATLSTFRKKDNKVLFGQNIIALGSGGQVAEGDHIELR